MEKGYKYLQMAGLALSVFVPALLLAGYSWRLGYVSTFGLNPEIVEKGLADVVVESWVVGVQVVAFVLPKFIYLPIVWMVLFLFFLGLLYFLTFLKKRGSLSLFAEEITRENQGGSYFGLTLWHWKLLSEAMEDVGNWLYWPFLVLAIAGCVVMFPFEKGKQSALEQLVEFRANGCAEHGFCTRLLAVDGGEEKLVAEGIVVSANSGRIAIYSGGGVGVYPLLDDRVLVRGLGEGVVVELGELLGALEVK